MMTRASEEPVSLSTARNHGSFCHKAALLADFHVKLKEIINHNLKNKMVPALQRHFLNSRPTLEGIKIPLTTR